MPGWHAELSGLATQRNDHVTFQSQVIVFRLDGTIVILSIITEFKEKTCITSNKVLTDFYS